MESIGEILKETRIRLNVSLEQVARDTHITQRYLEALEEERFSEFPGETYLKGFLRTYSSYLKLDPEEVIEKYIRIKMAESPTPIEQLIPKPQKRFNPLFLYAVILLIAVSFLTVFFVKKNKKNERAEIKVKQEKEIDTDKSKSIFTLKDIGKEKVFNLKKGDVVDFKINDEKYFIKIKELAPTVIINDSAGHELFLIKSYHHKVDLDKDDNNDLDINLNFWDNAIANITLKLFDQESYAGEEKVVGENAQIIAEQDKAGNIQMSLVINDPTYLRFKIDEQGEVEGFYNQSTQVLTASNRIILWASNAGALNLNFAEYKKDLSIGNAGQVTVKMIQWEENPSGKYELQISDLN